MRGQRSDARGRHFAGSRALVLAGLVAMYGLVTGFTGCFSSPYPTFDLATAGDGQWVVAATNTGVSVQPWPWSNNPPPPETFPLSAVNCGGCGGDPQVRVDGDGRWWYSTLVFSPTSTGCNGPVMECLSVSTGTDPRGPFYGYLFPNAVDGLRLGVTSDKVTLTGSFNDGYNTLVINRADAIAGVFPRYQVVPQTNLFLAAQIVSASHPADMFLYGASPAASTKARIAVVRGVPGTSDTVKYLFKDVTVGYNLAAGAPWATQPDGSTVENFATDAWPVFNGSSLWTAHTGVDGSGAPRLYVSEFSVKAKPFSASLKQTASVTPPDSGGSLACPSVAADLDDDVVVGFSAGSPSHYLGAYLTMRRNYDALGTLRTPLAVAPGMTPPNPNPSHVYRLDFCMGAVGPDGYQTWSAQQYQDASHQQCFGDNTCTSSANIAGLDPRAVQ